MHIYIYIIYSHIYWQLKNSVRLYIPLYMYMYLCMHSYLYIIYISNWETLRDCVCVYTCTYLCVCILAKEEISKNNVTKADKRMRVKCFHRGNK